MPSEEPDLKAATREVHRRYATGVTIVTTLANGVPYGLAVNAFSSLCLEPPLVLVCVATTSATHPHLYGGDKMGINVLANDQADVLGVFAQTGIEKFAQVEWEPGKSGVPILTGAAANLELIVEQRIPAFTHTIFIGRVIHAQSFDRPPLLYLDGKLYDGDQIVPVSSR